MATPTMRILKNPEALQALVAIAVAWGALFAPASHADDASQRATRLVVPYPAGGIVDYQARLLAAPIRRALGQEVIVENVSGAAGAIGLQRVLQSTSGDEIAFGTDSDAVLAPMANADIRYKPEDFRLLGVVMNGPMVLVAAPGVATNGLRTWLEVAKNGQDVSFGNYGVGSNAHVVADEFARRSAIKPLHVSYRGVAPLLQDLMGGQVAVAFLPFAGNIPEMLASGRLRPIGFTSAQRLAQFPAVPTINEAANFNDFVHRSWSGVLVPQSMALSVAQRYQASLRTTMSDPSVRTSLDASGTTVEKPMSLEEAEQFYNAEISRYRKLMQSFKVSGAQIGR